MPGKFVHPCRIISKNKFHPLLMSEMLYKASFNRILNSQQHVQNLHLRCNNKRNPMSIQICQCTVESPSVHSAHTSRIDYARRTNVVK
jgi:hypothetical protein